MLASKGCSFQLPYIPNVVVASPVFIPRADNWDANIFCQERTQLFRLSGYLHDQVELTDTGRLLTDSTPRPIHSPRARPAARAAAPRNHHQHPQAARPDPYANHPNHRGGPANPRRDNLQVVYLPCFVLRAAFSLSRCVAQHLNAARGSCNCQVSFLLPFL